MGGGSDRREAAPQDHGRKSPRGFAEAGLFAFAFLFLIVSGCGPASSEPVGSLSCAKFDRPDESCPPGWLCHPKEGCYPAGAMPCPDGSYCKQGTVCLGGGKCL